uniref:SREBP regulating gene protein n=1 Tax=Percolomonas cosmopolitus TaxID=63605 RepID=A0A7S1KLV7_9EUKA|eukprot:CAMPEP_0117447348 /NCGR_PEP_ID=MMETSP0759-20121206/6828_1 /TAXON_ID=63605 /ORGANISM="Percolomonas cosmopolitus, Strain WS" /LENGTH=213 /DNA_ID=CAMNT_0005239679 /DNA_START=37 /DNA_END=678 /DNA_ORIENTATION=-
MTKNSLILLAALLLIAIVSFSESYQISSDDLSDVDNDHLFMRRSDGRKFMMRRHIPQPIGHDNDEWNVKAHGTPLQKCQAGCDTVCPIQRVTGYMIRNVAYSRSSLCLGRFHDCKADCAREANKKLFEDNDQLHHLFDIDEQQDDDEDLDSGLSLLQQCHEACGTVCPQSRGCKSFAGRCRSITFSRSPLCTGRYHDCTADCARMANKKLFGE